MRNVLTAPVEPLRTKEEGPYADEAAYLTASSFGPMLDLLNYLRATVLIVDPRLSADAQAGKHDSMLMQRPARMVILTEPELCNILVPLRLHTSHGTVPHWALLHLDVDKKTAEYADSLYLLGVEDQAKEVAQRIVETILGDQLGIWRNWSWEKVDCAQQADSASCGVYMLVFVWFTLLGRHAPVHAFDSFF